MEHIDFEKIKKNFNYAVTKKKNFFQIDKYENKTRMIASNYMVYSFAALPVLIEKMKQIDPWDAGTINSVRFVVEENGNCWFALEGSPGDTIDYLDKRPQPIEEQIPAHSDIIPSKSCISSGIIVFSNKYQIEKITNFSGHFRPTPGSLVWIISCLLTLGANFSPDIELKFLWKKDHSLKTESISLIREDLHKLIPEQCMITPNSEHIIGVFSNRQWQYYREDETPEFKKCERKSKRSCAEINEDPISASSISIFADTWGEKSYDSPRSARTPSPRIDYEPFSDDEQDKKSNSDNMLNHKTLVSLCSIFAESKSDENPAIETETEITGSSQRKKFKH